MSHIRSRNTKPEVKLRKELFRLGYRYRLNVKGLDGSPDIVLAKADFRHTVSETQRQLDINRESWLEEMADRMKRREKWKEEMRRRKEKEMVLTKQMHD